MCVFYGGLVKFSNVIEIFVIFNVDGVFVGGVSFKVSDFIVIIVVLDVV